jgi:hypothetical protein
VTVLSRPVSVLSRSGSETANLLTSCELTLVFGPVSHFNVKKMIRSFLARLPIPFHSGSDFYN